MPASLKRKTSLTLDSNALDTARALGLNVSAVADAALQSAVKQAQRDQWQADNAPAFEAQAQWHADNGHPLADILTAPGSSTWKD